ncbi:MAG: hypothetical protein ACRDUV_27335 [Pseudonocardiaceae bacterium]
MVGLSAMATALALSVVAAVADTGIKLGLSDLPQPPVDDSVALWAAFEGITAVPVGPLLTESHQTGRL